MSSFVSTEHQSALAWLEQIARPLPEATVTASAGTWLFYILDGPGREREVSAFISGEVITHWCNDVRLHTIQVEPLVENAADGTLRSATLEVLTTWEIGPAFEKDLLPTSLPASSPDYFLSEEGKWVRRIQFGHYLLSQESKLLSQFDTVGLDSREWRPGDIFQLKLPIPIPLDLPPGQYKVAVALYFYPAVVNIALLDSNETIFYAQSIHWPID